MINQTVLELECLIAVQLHRSREFPFHGKFIVVYECKHDYNSVDELWTGIVGIPLIVCDVIYARVFVPSDNVTTVTLSNIELLY